MPMPMPSPARLAHHEAGHAVIQNRVARGRFSVTCVSLDTGDGRVAGRSLIDREVTLGLYEFGLVTLAGIAAENRYFRDVPSDDGERWGAVGDTEEWLAAAREMLQSDARIEMVTKRVMQYLQNFFADGENWSVVTELAKLLLEEGTVKGERLHALLERQYLPL
jgi:hypothetical protein